MIMYKQKIIDIDLINLNNRHTFKQNTPKKTYSFYHLLICIWSAGISLHAYLYKDTDKDALR